MADTVPPQVVLDPATRTVSPGTLEMAGRTGFLHWEGSAVGHVWTDYATGVTTGRALPVGSSSLINTSSDVIAYKGSATGEIRLVDAVGGRERTMQLPEGFTLKVMRGDTALATTVSAGGTSECHLFRLDGTDLSDRKVTGMPSGAPCTAVDSVSAGTGDNTVAVVRYSVAGAWHFGLVGLDTAALTELPLPAGPQNIQVTKDYISWHDVVAHAVNVLPRADLQAAARVIPDSSTYGTQAYLVGNRVFRMVGGYGTLTVVAPTGEAGTALHSVPSYHALAGPDGSLLVTGEATVPGDYAVHHFTADAEGVPVRAEVFPVPWQPSHSARIALAAGRIASSEADPHGEPLGFVDRQAAVSGSPTESAKTYLGEDVTFDAACRTAQGCPEVFPTVDGRLVYGTIETTGARLHVVDAAHKAPGTQRDLGTTWLTVDGVSSHYVTYETGTATASRTEVRDLDTLSVVHTGPAGATALWGGTLWQAGAGGKLTATALATGAVTRTLATGASCTVSRLQASARHLYWECGTKPDSAGVVDLGTGRATALGAGATAGRLGDGFVARLDSDRQVTVTDLTGAAPVERLLGGTANSTVPGVGWAADPYSGLVAYEAGDQQVRLARTGTGPAPLAQIDATVPAALTVDSGPGWTPSWWLSKPAASWTLQLRNKATGATVDTLSGGVARGLIKTTWDGVPSAGHPVPNGTYTWTLTAQPADGQGAALTKTGALKVTGGAAVRRDANSDGVGDLLTMNGSGGLTFQLFNGAGKLSGGISGGGWPTTAYAVPFGDFSGDRCNDVLVRYTSGELRSYKPACGKAVTPSTPYVKVGASGWQQYDVLTSPGDLNGDGLPDLVARQKTTGDMYFYAGRSDGKFAAKVKIFTNWKTYGQIAGVGDITGDGKADLIAHDKAGGLWRYDGTGKGTFKARVKVFSNWGTSYNTIVGVGDVTGDGKADLVERDTGGKLFRNDGNGKGSFGGRTQIATDWQGYKGVF
ncbi:FG-GAP-like repeat-containing protein [Streptomyces sp. NBC_01465]|uniref:FG-GAP-like repeat-containing protein n=1 Tax=Streptomyces sp. NBC_01465 TaxID=2903878 RepID=UPI002E357463|nr:FG-GAP-like repeat-containing protein [Streptomyces sp. NBC_01465]